MANQCCATNCRPGDLWQLGPHRLVCGDALDAAVVDLLMGDEQARRVDTSDDHSNIEPILITVPIQLHRAGRNKPVIIQSAEQPYRDPDLIAMVADARRWARLLTTEAASSVEAITKSDGIARGIVSRLLPLAWLAPDITTAILEGLQPRSPTAAKFRELGELPLPWEDQREILGFADADRAITTHLTQSIETTDCRPGIRDRRENRAVMNRH